MLNLYAEKLQNIVERNEEDLNKWKGITFSAVEDLITGEIATILKVIYSFIKTDIKIPVASFAEIDKMVLKFMHDLQGICDSQNNIEKKTFRGLILTNLKLTVEAIIMKSMWC